MTHWFDDTLTAAEATRKLSSAALAKFHAYNRNGLLREWSALGDRLLDFGRGYLAYGDCGYYRDEMWRLAKLKRVSPHTMYAMVTGIRRVIDKGEAFLAEQVAA
jgi:hypothetical protein